MADRFIDPHLRESENVESSVRGVIPGFTRWSSLGGGVSIAAALLIPQIFDLGIVVGILVIVAIVTVGFVGVLQLVGRPMARRHHPPLTTPYVTLALTDKRLMVIERAGSGEQASTLIEEHPRGDVRGVTYTKGGWFSPHRLTFSASGGERAFEFPKMEKVERFTEALG